MDIKPFTMEEVDAEIMQIVQQQVNEKGLTAGPQSIKEALLNRVKPKGNSNNGSSQT